MCVGSIAIHEDMVNVEILNTAPFLGKTSVACAASVVLPNLVCTSLETNYLLHALRSERDHVQSD